MADDFTTDIADDVTTRISDVFTAAVQAVGGEKGTFITEFEHSSILQHALAVLIFAALGLFGNGLTIHIYRKKITKGGGGNYYIQALAIVDIFALCTLLPMNPFMTTILPRMKHDFMTVYNIYVILASSVALQYLWILLAMTIERLVAVFKPLKIKLLRKPIQRSILGLSLSHFALKVFHFFLLTFKLSDTISMVIYKLDEVIVFLILSAILVAYPAIIYKLLRHGSAMSECTDTNAEHEPANRRSMARRLQNLTAVRIFIALFLLLIVSYIPTIAFTTGLVNQPMLTYLYFINHTGNPIAYYVINERFRKEVNLLVAGRCRVRA